MGPTRGEMESPSANGKYKEEDEYPSLLDTAEGQLRGMTHTVSQSFPVELTPGACSGISRSSTDPLPVLSTALSPFPTSTTATWDPLAPRSWSSGLLLGACSPWQQLRALLESLIFSKLFKRQLLHLRMKVVAGPNNDGDYAWSITACSH